MSFEGLTHFKDIPTSTEPLEVEFVESMQVTQGVVCDVYRFRDQSHLDLGIITIDSGCKTLLQKVLAENLTLEGYISGTGRLFVTKPKREIRIYEVSDNMQKPFAVAVGVGEIMQWRADDNSQLCVYEVCYPPYTDGRYENLEE